MSLDELFIKYGSDKGSLHHNYSPVYEKILEPLKSHPTVLLELGIGGYHYNDRGGGCIKAFDAFLPYALIIGIDIFEKKFLDKLGRIYTYVSSQTNEEFFIKLRASVGDFDIIIDDASHICSNTIKSFEILFPMVKSRGTYIIEDVHSSYWDEIAIDGTDFGGGNHDMTTMNYFKRMCDALNMDECGGRGILKGFDVEAMVYRDVESITFYHKMIVIKKK